MLLIVSYLVVSCRLVSQVEHVNSEVHLLATCNHPFTLRLIAAFQDASQLYMVLEIILGGELFMLHEREGK